MISCCEDIGWNVTVGASTPLSLWTRAFKYDCHGFPQWTELDWILTPFGCIRYLVNCTLYTALYTAIENRTLNSVCTFLLVSTQIPLFIQNFHIRYILLFIRNLVSNLRAIRKDKSISRIPILVVYMQSCPTQLLSGYEMDLSV